MHLVLCITTMLNVIVRVSYLIYQFDLDLIIHMILGLHPIFVVFLIAKPAFLDQELLIGETVYPLHYL